MADRLYTSNEADEILSALRFETKLEKATLARMAFALSLSRVGDEAHNYLSQKNIFLQRIIREGRSKGVVVFLPVSLPTITSRSFSTFRNCWSLRTSSSVKVWLRVRCKRFLVATARPPKSCRQKLHDWNHGRW